MLKPPVALATRRGAHQLHPFGYENMLSMLLQRAGSQPSAALI
jgi:hypothetical protein